MDLPLATWVRALALAATVAALVPATAGPDAAGNDPGAARTWLAKIHSAAKVGNYQGTMVFTAPGVVSSTRIAHFCVGDQAYERIEALDGKQRRVFRHNDVVHTVWPQAGVVVIERRSAQAALPSTTMPSVDPRALDQYELRAEGRERVAGREAVVMLLHPRDELRFAQRLWVDHDTGLMLRADVIGPGRVVLESSAFSEVEIGVRPQPDSVMQPIRKLEGMRILKRVHVPTQLEAEGWALTKVMPGFHPTVTYKRPLDMPSGDRSGPGPDVVQAVFSDGLTHVSLFIEPFDAGRHRRDLMAQFGATHTLSVRRGESWVTAMGDVPASTLRQFVDALERRRP